MTDAAYYPVFLDLRGRACVVLGDGPLADEKATGLRDAGARVTHQRRSFATGDLSGAHLAIDASGDALGQEAARAEADAHGVLLNVVDVASRCDWIAPAVVRRGPLQVAVSTAGESPFLASTLREHFEHVVGAEWGPFTSLMGRMRRTLRRHGVPRERQERAFRTLLRSSARASLAAGRVHAAAAVAAEIEAEGLDGGTRWGDVVLVGAGPGDPGLLTVAGRDALFSADVVLHDALVDPRVLQLCRHGARLVDAGKRGGRASAAQEWITATLLAEARAGHRVVRLKGGDPFIFGRGGEEVAALAAAGVAVSVIPGVSTITAGPALAGIPLTFRGVAASVAVVTAHRTAGEPHALERAATAADTLVVLMPGDLAALAERLAPLVGAQRPAAILSDVSGDGEQVVRTVVAELGGHQRRSGTAPTMVVVGDVVAHSAGGAYPATRPWTSGVAARYAGAPSA